MRKRDSNMLFIDKLFCKHDFQIYYFGDSSPSVFCTYDTPTTYLRCKKCGKIRKVNNYWLMKHAKFYAEERARHNIKGYEGYDISIYPFKSQPYGYEGYVAYKLMQEVFLFDDGYMPVEKRIDLARYRNKSI